MSSPPMLDLGIAGGGGAAGSLRPMRQQAAVAADIADPVLGRVSNLLGEGERGFSPIAAESASASNVIELDSPLRRSSYLDRASASPRQRINPFAVELAVRLSDASVLAIAGAAAYWLQPLAQRPLDLTAAFTALAVMAMLLRFPDQESRLLDDAMRRPLSRRLADAALRTLLPFVCGVLVVIALVPADNISQAPLTHWLTMWAMGAVAGIGGVRLCLAAIIGHWRGQGRFKQAVAIFGSGELAERLLERLRASCSDSIELVGLFDDRARRRIVSAGQRSLTLGTADDLVALSRRRDIDRVLVALPHAAEHRVVAVLKKLRQMPVEISLAPDHIGYSLPTDEVDELGGLPLLGLHGKPLTFGQVLLKSAIDKVLAASALVLGAPLLLALAIVIRLDSRGPVFFRQNRDGFGDRVIRVYKFRTMYADVTDHECRQQTRPNDPRVTRIGHFLRRWSLDELPQLINVLRGEMSLVGPRPHAVSMRVEERANRDIVPDYAMRHHVKPGITGWAQVNGYHGPVATEEALRARVRYDLEYINNWSPWFDLQILLRTLTIVLGQRNAY